ncbi:MAG: hypothetical protein Q7U98_00790 [Methylicorpusculum sp.]|uniref:hypothetical protein n=1 Tax=Methylicorpusculum sp. TaxID=2713644 RepID=UPI002722CB7A|nr:hypothetical protein [Methylicorpusculum sp.]MDO8937676.1 hypothetical protein [Methylicorpusculum sp.]MDP2204353.1 hypothetical protein [Methylicorpusculum sp.]
MINHLPYSLLALLFTCSTAWANEPANSSTKSEGKQNCPSFSTLDNNHDDLISRDEGLSNEYVARYWDTLDVDLDGSLTPTEFAKLGSIMKREKSLKTDHPQNVEQYKKGKYISPNEQIERNRREGKQ